MGGFLANLLGGIGDSITSERARNEKQAQLDQQEQQSVYQYLLSHGDENTQAIGLTGLLEPPKKSPFGKLKESDTYRQALQVIQNLKNGGAPPQPGAAPPPGPSLPPSQPAPPGTPVPTAAMPDTAPLTGGGGKTASPPPPPPGAPGSVWAPGDIGATADMSSPGANLQPLPPPPPMPPQPHERIAAATQAFDPRSALKEIEDKEKRTGFVDPEMASTKKLLQQAIMFGATPEEVRAQAFPVAARTAAASAKTHWQGKPVTADAVPPGALDMAGNPLALKPNALYLPTLIGGDPVPRYAEAPPPQAKAGKIVYDTVGNKRVAKLVNASTGEVIKPNVSEQEIAMGHAVMTDNAGNQTLIQFSNVPNSGAPAPSASKPAAAPPPPPAPSAPTPGTKPSPTASPTAGIALGNKNKLPGQQLGQVTQAEGAYQLFDQVKKQIEDAGMQDAKDLGDSLKRRWESAKYTHGIGQDQFNHDLQQLLSAADLKMVSTFTSGGRMSPQIFDRIRQHLTRPDTVPPGVIYDDIKNLQSMIKDFGATTYRNAKVQPPEGSLFAQGSAPPAPPAQSKYKKIAKSASGPDMGLTQDGKWEPIQ